MLVHTCTAVALTDAREVNVAIVHLFGRRRARRAHRAGADREGMWQEIVGDGAASKDTRAGGKVWLLTGQVWRPFARHVRAIKASIYES